ncbi:cadherin-like beta sandwich domain-containing protein [Hungatella hathewayi]|uniref:cadherin-like beta sandwich domain-containing protein n=1 Tax=Hungatella hathewayi TaxID=154046 RepID=UPI003565C0D2
MKKLFRTSIFTLVAIFLLSLTAFAKENTTIIMLNPEHNYEVGDKVTVTVGVSSTDGSYLKSADCGFGYNASTMKLLTTTDSYDHFYIESKNPAKWLYYDLEFEMINDGKMYFIAGAYSGEGIIKAIKSDGSRIDLPRASLVYKIGTGIYTKVSDCNLKSMDLKDEKGMTIKMNRDFDKNITEYWIEVDAAVSELVINGETENPEDKIILPDKIIEPGESTKEIIIEATDHTQKAYILHITKPEQQVTVENIQITGNDEKNIEYDFSQETLEYILSVDNETTELSFKGLSDSEYVKFDYPETVAVKVGYNNYVVKAWTDNQEKIYNFNIFREPSSLQILSIIGELSDDTTLSLDQEFSPEITEYSANVKADVQRAKFIYTLANIEDSILEDPEYKLEEGMNECKLTVTDGIDQKVYTIMIFREPYEKVVSEESKTVGPIINSRQITEFVRKDLKFLLFLGFILLAGITIFVVMQLRRNVEEYTKSEEALAEKTEKERKRRLKQKEKERKKKN